MKNILVPYDFSETAFNAVRFAISLAKKSSAVVNILHVIELPVIPDPLFLELGDIGATYRAELTAKVDSRMSELIEKNAEGLKIMKYIRFGLTATSIVEFIDEKNIDMVVMGSHGVSGFREIFIGSTTEKVVRKSPVPVIVVKNPIDREVMKIVFPCSLPIPKSAELIGRVKDLQNFFGAHLSVVRINTPDGFTRDDISQLYLKNFADYFKLTNYSLHIWNDVDAEEGIINFSKYINADMIAMGTHSYRGLSHLFLGSITEDVANHAGNLIWTYSLHHQPVSVHGEESLLHSEAGI